MTQEQIATLVSRRQLFKRRLAELRQQALSIDAEMAVAEEGIQQINTQLDQEKF